MTKSYLICFAAIIAVSLGTRSIKITGSGDTKTEIEGVVRYLGPYEMTTSAMSAVEVTTVTEYDHEIKRGTKLMLIPGCTLSSGSKVFKFVGNESPGRERWEYVDLFQSDPPESITEREANAHILHESTQRLEFDGNAIVWNVRCRCSMIHLLQSQQTAVSRLLRKKAKFQEISDFTGQLSKITISAEGLEPAPESVISVPGRGESKRHKLEEPKPTKPPQTGDIVRALTKPDVSKSDEWMRSYWDIWKAYHDNTFVREIALFLEDMIQMVQPYNAAIHSLYGSMEPIRLARHNMDKIYTTYIVETAALAINIAYGQRKALVLGHDARWNEITPISLQWTSVMSSISILIDNNGGRDFRNSDMYKDWLMTDDGFTYKKLEFESRKISEALESYYNLYGDVGYDGYDGYDDDDESDEIEEMIKTFKW